MERCDYCDLLRPTMETAIGNLCINCQLDTGFVAEITKMDAMLPREFCMHIISFTRDTDRWYLNVKPLIDGVGVKINKPIEGLEFDAAAKLSIQTIKDYWFNHHVNWHWMRGDEQRVLRCLLGAISTRTMEMYEKADDKKSCPDCGVLIGERHNENCDRAHCGTCGSQFIAGCDCANAQPDIWFGF